MMFRIRLSLVTLSLFAGISAIAVAEEHNHDDEFSHQEQLSNTAGGSSKPWGEAILASLLVNLVTLVGVFFLSGEHVAKHVLKRDIAKSPYYLTFTQNVIPSFACGALLATTVFLMLPEALHLISAQFEDGHDHRLLREKSGENQASWRFGICIISGFLLPTLTELIFCHKIEVDRLQDITEAAVLDVESSKKNTSDSSETSENVKVDAETVLGLQCSTKTDLLVANLDRTDTKAIDWSLASSVLAGDFFHNFADGIFIGTAFLMCSRDLAIAISLATVYHELAQEIADYFLLTRFCNIPPFYALLLNFLDGLSIVFGACLILGIEDMSNLAIGCLLAISAGVYIYVALVECFPRAKAGQKTLKDRLIAFSAFVIGVIPIGLVLLNHGHCVAEGEHAH